MARRHHGLDAARALAMIAVVSGHAGLSFIETPIGWAIQDRSRHIGVDLWLWIVRAFAMPTFFWLAGYFSRALLVHGGLGAFVRNRVTRILLPLAIALVPCSLALDALWEWGRVVSPPDAVAANAPKFQKSEIPIFFGHLWFLYYLLWLSLVAAVIARIAREVPRWLPTLVVPAGSTIGVLLVLGALHTDTPLGFVPDLAILVYMGGFFGWGWMVHARPDDLELYAAAAARTGVAAIALLGVVILTLSGGIDAIEAPPPYAILASGLFSIAMMVTLLGGCVRWLATPRPVLRLASDSSYWFYVLHLPAVVLMQVSLATVAVPGPLKYLAIVSVTTVACVGSYALVGRVGAARRPRPASRSSAPHR